MCVKHYWILQAEYDQWYQCTAWNSKQPVLHGCFNWMIPNHCMKNLLFSKHFFFKLVVWCSRWIVLIPLNNDDWIVFNAEVCIFNDFSKSLSLGMFHVLRKKNGNEDHCTKDDIYRKPEDYTHHSWLEDDPFLFGGNKKMFRIQGLFLCNSTPPKKKLKTVNLEDAFPFPMVGYATSLEGTSENFPGKGCRSHRESHLGVTCCKTFYKGGPRIPVINGVVWPL